ncbi:MAG TPA: tRNA (N6-isopentenyl adenosine(37)-C2)-methylthiotransferase MiaB, partial [Psychrobacter sp.]|nr:tRNA (N6-isopentenyl adenosine(37)-C2)-methylthiotransferase MiaB [Psychrobacter sp.]
ANRHPDCLIGTADNTRTVMFPYDVDKIDEMLGKIVSVRITDFVSPHMVKGEIEAVLA